MTEVKIDWKEDCHVTMAKICNNEMWLEYKKWLCLTGEERQSYACEYSRKMNHDFCHNKKEKNV